MKTTIALLREDKKYVTEQLQQGEFEAFVASELTVADKIIVTAIEDELVKKITESFPEKRKQIEIPTLIVVGSMMASRLLGIKAMKNIPYAIQSAELISTRLGRLSNLQKDCVNSFHAILFNFLGLEDNAKIKK